MERNELCWYELIHEDSPCKLYFDLEYSCKHNPNANGDEMVEILKDELIVFVRKELNLVISRDDMIDLTSSTEIKFSRHLIVDLPGTVFINNRSCGDFVYSFCRHIRSTKQHLAVLFVSVGGHTTVLFVDETVYTRHRSFRVLGSSKLKNIHQRGGVFLTYAQNQARPNVKSDQDKFLAWKKTLVCSVTVDSQTRIINFHHRGLPSVYRLRKNSSPTVSCSTFSSLDLWVSEYVSKWGPETAPWVEGMVKAQNIMTNTAALRQQTVSGIKVLRDDCGDVSTITYYTNQNLFCCRVGRPHKSNSIFFIVRKSNS